MRRLLVLASIVFAAASPAEAQLSCGTVENLNSSWQVEGLKYVEALVQTKRSWSICPLEVQVEAWVSGVGGAAVHRSTYVAEVHLWRAVPAFTTYTTYGKHWLIAWGRDWYYNGTTASFATVKYTSAMRCEDKGGYWDGTQCVMSNTPILIDTGNDGYRLTSVEDGVRFDLDVDGQPELVAWTPPDSNDCWLAMDRNGNGRIDDGSELFGNKAPAYADQAEPTTADGFAGLQFLEGPTYGRSRADGVIDADDAPFNRLLFWCDANHNGASESTELQSAADAGYTAFRTDSKMVGRKDRWGNLFRLKGAATGPHGEQTIYDVYLQAAKQ